MNERHADFLHVPDWSLRMWIGPLATLGLAVIVYALPAVQPGAGLHTASMIAGEAPITVHGLSGAKDAYVLVRNLPCKPACPQPLVVEFILKLPAPNTLI